MKLLFFTFVSLFAFNAFAGKIGQAGCGLGNQILGSEPGAIQIVAATSNGIYGNQTSGITSGTSNCLDTNVGAAVEVFVEENKVALSNDISRGQGETVAVLNRMLSCANEKVAAKALQGSFEQISEQKSSEEMTQVIRQTLRQTPQAGCSEA
jgi:hypothetical protein